MIKFKDNIIKRFKLNHSKIFDYYIILIICSVILLSRNTMITTCIIGFENSFLISIILFVPLYIIALKKVINRQIDFKKITIIIMMLIFIVISVILKKDMQAYNFSILYYIISAIVLILTIDYKKIQKYYINIIFILACFSLITTYIIKPLIFSLEIDNSMRSTNFIIKNSVGYEFLNLGLGFAVFNENYDRNYGVFTEPSFFQFYLIIAIIFLLFEKNKRVDWLRILIYIITVYTTKSAAGYIAVACILGIYITKYFIENRKEYKKILKMLMVIMLLFILLLINPNIRRSIDFVYTKITVSNESSISRFGSVEFAVKKFINSPIIGNKIADILLYENDLTNTIFTIGAIYGVIPLLSVIYFILKFSNKFKQNNIITMGIFITIMLSSNSHLFIGIQSFWVLMLLGFGEDKNENTLDS